jgi:nicotinate-nucleotide adenylyltransferase
MRIGILGGTFDPIHEGHLHLAREALRSLELEKVIFIPTNRSPFKTQQVTAEASHRLKMVELALEGEPRMEISDIEISSGEVTYTIDTLRQLKSRYPENAVFFLLLGADTFDSLDQWKEPDKIKNYCRIAVAARLGNDAKGEQVFTRKTVPYSATEIRRCLESGSRPEGLPDVVFAYIQTHNLYKN